MLGPVDGNRGLADSGGQSTQVLLPCTCGSENMATKFAKLVLFSSVKSVFTFLSHSG